jgi:hypothetical protein
MFRLGDITTDHPHRFRGVTMGSLADILARIFYCYKRHWFQFLTGPLALLLRFDLTNLVDFLYYLQVPP